LALSGIKTSEDTGGTINHAANHVECFLSLASLVSQFYFSSIKFTSRFLIIFW
jgi:hypothetical protein